MPINASVTIAVGEKSLYICLFLCGEALRQFETLYVQVGQTTNIKLRQIILGLYTFSSLVNVLSKQKFVSVCRSPEYG